MVENPEFVLMDLTKFLAISAEIPTMIEFFCAFVLEREKKVHYECLESFWLGYMPAMYVFPYGSGW